MGQVVAAAEEAAAAGVSQVPAGRAGARQCTRVRGRGGGAARRGGGLGPPGGAGRRAGDFWTPLPCWALLADQRAGRGAAPGGAGAGGPAPCRALGSGAAAFGRSIGDR